MATDAKHAREAAPFTVEAWGATLAGLHWPGGGLPVLALHGWLDNAASFAPLAQHMKADIHALDFSGHGLSDHRPPDMATHYIDHIRDVLRMADLRGMEKCHLVGHSMGAGVATLFAATFPDRVATVTLIEGLGPPATDADQAPTTLRKAIEDMLSLPEKRMPVYADMDAAIAARMKGFGGLEESASRLLCERGLKPVEGGWTWRSDPRLRLGSSLRLTEDQVAGFLKAIKAPVLLIEGEQGMAAMKIWAHREHWVSQLHKVTLPGRHHLHMENAEMVAPEIEAFWEKGFAF